MEGSSKILFRRFEERDAEGIRSIYPQFFEDCPQLKFEEGFIVAEINGMIVGFFVVVTQMTYPWWDRNVKSWCEIVELHVHHMFWRKGIGMQLVRKAIDYQLIRFRRPSVLRVLIPKMNTAFPAFC